MVTQDEKQCFRTWLGRTTNLSEKVMGDIMSRLARIEKITPLHTNGGADDFLFQLGKKTEFSSLGQSVKSQLKRAYKFYHQFKGDK